MNYIFYTLIFLSAYSYCIYPLIVFVLSLLFGDDLVRNDVTPSMSVIISVFNEERIIEEKLINTLSLEYSKDLLEIIVVSDGSTDNTNDIVSNFSDPRLVLKAFTERSGKTACLNRIVPEAKGEIIVFTDANSMFPSDTLSKIARNFADPSIGLVTGWTKYLGSEGDKETTGLYSRLEKMTKYWESLVCSCVGADGAIFALRKTLYKPLQDYDINDFVIPLNAVAQNRRVVLDPEVFCLEQPSQDELKEFRRQARITTRTLGAIHRNLRFLNPLKFGLFSFFLLSHKLIRFMVPFFLVGTLLAGVVLFGNSIICAGIFLAQLFFIIVGVAGIFARLKGRLADFCKFFLVTSLAQLAGWVRFLFGKTDTMWTPQR